MEVSGIKKLLFFAVAHTQTKRKNLRRWVQIEKALSNISLHFLLGIFSEWEREGGGERLRGREKLWEEEEEEEEEKEEEEEEKEEEERTHVTRPEKRRKLSSSSSSSPSFLPS